MNWCVIRDDESGLYFWRAVSFDRRAAPSPAWTGDLDEALVFPSIQSAQRAVDRYALGGISPLIGVTGVHIVRVEAEQRDNRRPSMVAVRHIDKSEVT